jgi:putative FmdB family regulatory protein
MPIYEYRCAACGFEKEYLQKLSDAPITDCERCGRPTMGKLVSAAGFQLKGSGWYATDFKNSGTKPKAKEEAKPKAKEESKPDAPAGDGGAKPSTDTKSSAESGAGACPACLPAQ